MRFVQTITAIVALGCARAPSEHSWASLSETRAPFGLPAPLVLQAVSFKWRWVAACFAQRDTNGDGVVRVLVGRHGHVHGDEVEPFLMLERSRAEPIDEFLGSSPGSRLLAVIERGRLVLIDAHTNQRWDLSTLGARVPSDGSPVLPHPAIRFSADGRVAFVRQGNDGLELVVFEPSSGRQTTVFRTKDEIARFDFEGSALQIRTLPVGMVDDSVQTTLAPRPCRGQAGSFLIFRRGPDPTQLVTVRIAKTTGPREIVEKYRPRKDRCTMDGLPAVASSEEGTRHLLASSLDEFWAERGPLRWGHGEVNRANCSPNARLEAGASD